MSDTDNISTQEQDRQTSAQQLQAEAMQLDGQNAPPPPPTTGAGNEATDIARNETGGEVITVEDTAQDIMGLINLATKLLAPVFPSLGVIYTPETNAALAGTLAPVLVKRGWKVANVAGKYADEVAFAMVAVPVILATYQGVRHDIRQHKAAAQAALEDEGNKSQAGKIEGAANG